MNCKILLVLSLMLCVIFTGYSQDQKPLPYESDLRYKSIMNAKAEVTTPGKSYDQNAKTELLKHLAFLEWTFTYSKQKHVAVTKEQEVVDYVFHDTLNYVTDTIITIPIVPNYMNYVSYRIYFLLDEK